MEEAGLQELKRKLAEEEQVYAELLAQLDELSKNPLPNDLDPEIPTLVGQLNQQWEVHAASPPAGNGLKGFIRGWARKIVQPEIGPLRDALARQQSFNSFLVQFVNRYTGVLHRRAARLSELSSTLVRFAQRIDRLADAKDRFYAFLGNTRADLLLEAMDKRLETVALGLRRAQDRVEGLVSSVELARTELASLKRTADAGEPSAPTEPSQPPAPVDAAEYVAFANRYRGSSEEIGERLRAYIPHLQELSPVVDLGCGRGEFLEILRESGIEAWGVDENPEMVGICRERGLTVEQADLLSYLRGIPADSMGGIFAAQVVEHLPPPVLRQALDSCHHALRKGGKLVLETVNPGSVVGLVGFYRDLTHHKPLHPETLDFLLRACGFRDVTIQYSSPIEERAKLQTVPAGDEATQTLNENFLKLNALLFGDLDYAAIATK